VTGPRTVSFPAGEATLHGYLFVPEGSGPFPAVAWNHGSERSPGSFDRLGAFYASAGYAFFCPHRRGHGLSPGPYAFGTTARRPRSAVIEAVIALHEAQLEDTLAALTWLGRQPFVEAGRLAMSGVSFGGIQTVLAAEAGAGARAFVPFAPAAIAWEGNPELQERLVQAVRAAAAPMFLVQAENDYSLGPSKVLGRELERKGEPNRVRVYPPYGDSTDSGHGAFACEGTDVWGADVCRFLEEVLT